MLTWFGLGAAHSSLHASGARYTKIGGKKNHLLKLWCNNNCSLQQRHSQLKKSEGKKKIGMHQKRFIWLVKHGICKHFGCVYRYDMSLPDDFYEEGFIRRTIEELVKGEHEQCSNDHSKAIGKKYPRGKAHANTGNRASHSPKFLLTTLFWMNYISCYK